MKIVPACLWVFLVFYPLAEASNPHRDGTGHAHQRYRDAKFWSKKFDDPKREKWQKPSDVIQALELNAEAKVADIGAGTGYFSFRIAKEIPRGKVFAADIETEMVQHLQDKAREKALANVEAVLLKASEPKLPEPSDVALVVNTYHHIQNREVYFRILRDSLKERGRLAIIDFNGKSKIGPPLADRIPPEIVKEELTAAGYKFVKELDFLPNQYFLLFQR